MKQVLNFSLLVLLSFSLQACTLDSTQSSKKLATVDQEFETALNELKSISDRMEADGAKFKLEMLIHEDLYQVSEIKKAVQKNGTKKLQSLVDKAFSQMKTNEGRTALVYLQLELM